MEQLTGGMMAEKPNLYDAVKQAAGEQSEDIDQLSAALSGTGEEPEAPAADDVGTPDAPSGDGADDVDAEATPGDESKTQTADDGGEGTDDIPTEYFGHDLSDLEPDARQKVIDVLKEQDKAYQAKMQRDAERDKRDNDSPDPPEPQRQATEPAAPDEEPSDEALLEEYYGLTESDPMFEVKAEMLLPAARRQFQTDQKLNRVLAERDATLVFDYWNDQLDSLESEHGAIVGSDGKALEREAVLQHAVDNGIQSPIEAYHTLAAPGRKAADEVSIAKAEALRKLKQQQAGGVRPTTGAAEKKEAIETMDLGEAMKQATKLAEAETGLSFEAASTPG